MSNKLLTKEELQNRLDEYWEFYRDLWNDDIINECDYESGFDYWALEAQRDLTAEIVRAEVLEQISKMPVFIYSKVLNTTVPIRDAPEWQALKKGEK